MQYATLPYHTIPSLIRNKVCSQKYIPYQCQHLFQLARNKYSLQQVVWLFGLFLASQISQNPAISHHPEIGLGSQQRNVK